MEFNRYIWCGENVSTKIYICVLGFGLICLMR